MCRVLHLAWGHVHEQRSASHTACLCARTKLEPPSTLPEGKSPVMNALPLNARLQGVKIVVVDDDADIRDAVVTVLEAEGAIVKTAADGNAAVDAVADEKPAVVVLDMMLPGRSGFLVLEKIKGEADSPQVVMLTANEGRRHQAYAESLGVERYLLKPTPMDKLVEVCRELADKYLAEQAAANRATVAPSKSSQRKS
jgi:DNA-binding response OmpR family regulator